MHQNNFGASDHRPKILGLNIAESDSVDNFLPVWWKVKGTAPAKETAPAKGQAEAVGRLMCQLSGRTQSGKIPKAMSVPPKAPCCESIWRSLGSANTRPPHPLRVPFQTELLELSASVGCT